MLHVNGEESLGQNSNQQKKKMGGGETVVTRQFFRCDSMLKGVEWS